MSGYVIDEIVIPERIDAPDAGDFVRSVEVGNVVAVDAVGTPDIAYEPAEELPQFRNPFGPRRAFVARVDGEIVARAFTETQAEEGADTTWVVVQVLPAFRGRGIGRALAETVEGVAAAEGRHKILAYVDGREPGGERIPSPTGFGSVSAEERSTRFLLNRGYRLEQVGRASRLPLPVPDLDRLFADAVAASGPDYAVHSWVGSAPERWRADLAVLITAMSTDSPDAGLGSPEDVWTAERVAENDARREREQPRPFLRTAAEHLPSGQLVAFSALSVPPQTHRAVQQYATLVRRDHRGHRLGRLVKIGNLVQLADVAPGRPSILTFNAEENRPMLDVNEALGFASIAYEGGWRKDLS